MVKALRMYSVTRSALLMYPHHLVTDLKPSPMLYRVLPYASASTPSVMHRRGTESS